MSVVDPSDGRAAVDIVWQVSPTCGELRVDVSYVVTGKQCYFREQKLKLEQKRIPFRVRERELELKRCRRTRIE